MTEENGFVVVPGHGDAAHPELELWHGNIGQPVAIDCGSPIARDTRVIDVLSWNVAIGLGRLEEVVKKVRAGHFDGDTHRNDRPLVVLVQEALRADDTVPHTLQSDYHGGKEPGDAVHDIVDIARCLDFGLRYAPSMRNGQHRSDRGNAILSSAAIGRAHAFPLPHVRQRRVAVAVELAGLPWLTFVSAHLDTRGRVRDTAFRWRYATGRAAQAGALANRLVQDTGDMQAVVIGADLNSYFGMREPLMRSLHQAGFERQPHTPDRSHTFHAPPLRMILDHIFVREPTSGIARVQVMRLDENARDSGRRVFGSDHHPLLARIEIKGVERRSDERA